LTARDNRRQQETGIARGENQARVARRLFECLQERVRRFLFGFFKAAQDDDFPASLEGRTRQIVFRIANLSDAKGASFPFAGARRRRRIFVKVVTRRHPFDDLHVGMAIARDLLAGGTFAARTRCAGALQRLRQLARQRRLANRVGTGEQVGVRHAFRRDALRERADCPRVSHQIPFRANVYGRGHARILSRLDTRAKFAAFIKNKKRARPTNRARA
jgi:hypothetical protein